MYICIYLQIYDWRILLSEVHPNASRLPDCHSIWQAWRPLPCQIVTFQSEPIWQSKPIWAYWPILEKIEENLSGNRALTLTFDFLTLLARTWTKIA